MARINPPRAALGALARLAAIGLDVHERRCQACAALLTPGAPEAPILHGPSQGSASPLCPSPLPLCAACAACLTPCLSGRCRHCGAILRQDRDDLCPACLTDPKPWRRFFFYGPYEGLLGDLLRRFKFNASLGLGCLLQTLAGHAVLLPGQNDQAPPDMVTPVPLHERRLFWRGYNQALELARGAALAANAPLLPEALRRTRSTRPQYGQSRSARLENLAQAFRARPELVRGKTILLVDDVMTTGATFAQCVAVLHDAGAAAVDVLALARADTDAWRDAPRNAPAQDREQG